jgi:hypothetical protein
MMKQLKLLSAVFPFFQLLTFPACERGSCEVKHDKMNPRLTRDFVNVGENYGK